MNFEDFRRRADAVREVPLDAVLICRGAVRDPRDKSKWRTEQGPVTVTGAKFSCWRSGRGGGGAIDLVMHLAGVNVGQAVAWLEQHMAATGETLRSSPSSKHSSVGRAAGKLCLPAANERLLDRVILYLMGRHLQVGLLAPLIASGRLYADDRGNAVFLLVAGKANRPVGAELRGTSHRIWRGMASGTCKDAGYFWVGARGSRKIVLCESAIDSISCFQLHPDCICISTSGVRSNPRWLCGLIARRYELHCGFDDDEAGDAAADAMLARYPTVQRLRPPAHDWNEALAVDSQKT
ncbi:MAG: toprim domain-containing protein [Planctomycetes bacterium]|nr:toprim domain-containing protein [Planctomycetota bacterium]